MRSISNIGVLVQAVESNAIRYRHNTAPFYDKLEKGQIGEVIAPDERTLLLEFTIPIKYDPSPIDEPIEPLKPRIPIGPAKPYDPERGYKPIRPIFPGTPIIKRP